MNVSNWGNYPINFEIMLKSEIKILDCAKMSQLHDKRCQNLENPACVLILAFWGFRLWVFENTLFELYTWDISNQRVIWFIWDWNNSNKKIIFLNSSTVLTVCFAPSLQLYVGKASVAIWERHALLAVGPLRLQ